MPVYLDYSASAPLKPAAKAAMLAALEQTGNASSVHGFGRAQRHILDQSRIALAERMKVKPEQVVFTSGATEANNMALNAFVDRRHFVSAIEHPSILQAAHHPYIIQVSDNCLIDINQLEDRLKKLNEPALICVMAVNNETGVIQPIKEIADLAKKHGAFLHVDAVQAFGRIPFDFERSGADTLSLSAHKIGGPQGVGALIIRNKMPIPPLLKGGGQESWKRAGTENIAAIRGFAAAVQTIDEDLAKAEIYAQWRDDMEAHICNPDLGAVVIAKNAPRAANITMIAMPNVKNETQLMAFDMAGYAVSSGSACSSGKVEPSHVLRAMGLDAHLATSAIRISFGHASVREELTGFAENWISFRSRQQQQQAA